MSVVGKGRVRDVINSQCDEDCNIRRTIKLILMWLKGALIGLEVRIGSQIDSRTDHCDWVVLGHAVDSINDKLSISSEVN